MRFLVIMAEEKCMLQSTRRTSLSPAQEQRLVALIQESLGHPFNVELTYVDEVSRSASGKFEDFLCLVAPSSGAGEVA